MARDARLSAHYAACEGQARALHPEWSDGLQRALERYVNVLDLAADAWAQLGYDLTAAGSTGQIVADPLVTVALKAEAEAARYGQTLGIEPAMPEKAKNKGGRPRGSAPLADLVPSSRRLAAVKGPA
jgi:hypothetical protein